MKKGSGFEKFFKGKEKTGGAKKEEIRQEKRAIRKEREEKIADAKRQKRAQYKATNSNEPPKYNLEPRGSAAFNKRASELRDKPSFKVEKTDAGKPSRFSSKDQPKRFQKDNNRSGDNKSKRFEPKENRFDNNRDKRSNENRGTDRRTQRDDKPQSNRFDVSKTSRFSDKKENRFAGKNEKRFDPKEKRFDGGSENRPSENKDKRRGQPNKNKFEGSGNNRFPEKRENRFPAREEKRFTSNRKLQPVKPEQRENSDAPLKPKLQAAAKPKPLTDQMPLNKYIAHSGVCSRRDAVDLIKGGKVKVNGELILEPGHKVALTDDVKVGGKKLNPVKDFVYILLNKPKDYITTTDDPQERKTVLDLLGGAPDTRIYPVGRLDRNTSGVLLLTNDGDLSQKLTHPSNEIKKVYAVTLDKPLTKHHFEEILKGVPLEDGVANVDTLAYTDIKDHTQIGVELHTGRNRIVRRIFEHFGYDVKALDRVIFAGLTKKNVNRGKWRFLSEKEVRDLKFFKKGRS